MSSESQKPANLIERKLKIAEGLFNFAYRVKSHQLKLKNPAWTAEQIHQKTIELIEKGCA